MKNKFLVKLFKIIIFAIILLVISRFLAERDYHVFLTYLQTGLDFIAGVIIGIIIPDIDIVIPKLNHRSAITHSCIPVLLLINLDVFAVTSGLALGVALHLSSDIQSKSWCGAALIKIPLLGSIGMLTPIWFLIQITLCLELCSYLLATFAVMHKLVAYVSAVMCSICYFYLTDERPLFPLLSFVFCILILYFLHSSHFVEQIINKYIF